MAWLYMCYACVYGVSFHSTCTRAITIRASQSEGLLETHLVSRTYTDVVLCLRVTVIDRVAVVVDKEVHAYCLID